MFYEKEIYKPLCTHSPSPSFLGSSLRREPFGIFEPRRKERRRMYRDTLFCTLLIHRKRSPRRLLANSTVASRHAPSREGFWEITAARLSVDGTMM